MLRLLSAKVVFVLQQLRCQAQGHDDRVFLRATLEKNSPCYRFGLRNWLSFCVLHERYIQERRSSEMT